MDLKLMCCDSLSCRAEIQAELDRLNALVGELTSSRGELQAQAGRAGFIAATDYDWDRHGPDDVIEMADRYADRIRQQANPFAEVHKARDEAKAALDNWTGGE